MTVTAASAQHHFEDAPMTPMLLQIAAVATPTLATLGVGWRLATILTKQGEGLKRVQFDLLEHTAAEEARFEEFRDTERRVTILETLRTQGRR
jgi:hypothetical protein